MIKAATIQPAIHCLINKWVLPSRFFKKRHILEIKKNLLAQMKCHPGRVWLSKLCYSIWENSLFELLYLPQKTSRVTFVQTQNKHPGDPKMFVPTRKATVKVSITQPYWLWSADAGLNWEHKIIAVGKHPFPLPLSDAPAQVHPWEQPWSSRAWERQRSKATWPTSV